MARVFVGIIGIGGLLAALGGYVAGDPPDASKRTNDISPRDFAG